MKKKNLLLGGNSGSEVFLYEDVAGHMLVRKQAKNIKQNKKVEEQYKKHIFFLRRKNILFGVPKIVRKGYENGLFFFDYTYIEGETLINYMKKKNLRDIKTIINKCFVVIEYLRKRSEYFEKEFSEKNLQQAFVEKILTNCNKLKLDALLKEKLLTMARCFGSFEEKTLAHGDFTFDNIIIDANNKVWLIDYHGGFYPHYFMDIAKLLQDTDGRWYEIKHNIKINKEKISALNDYMKRKIEKLNSEYMKHHNFLMAVVFLRSMPYMKTALDKKKILRKIEAFANLM